MANLCFLHGTMQASEQLLKLAILIKNPLTAYYEQHLKEETGHMELLKKDIETMGIKEIVKFRVAAEMVGAQYYYIFHEGTFMLLGFMLAMESSPMSLEQVDDLENKYGPLPCLRHHSIHDVDHKEDLQRMMATLPARNYARAITNYNETRLDFIQRAIPAMQAAERYFI
jgi:hypothetical protein